MTYAYDQTLLYKARITLAWMFDYGVNEYGIEIDEFFRRFINSGIAASFAEGNPSIVAGRSGEELAYEVVSYADSTVDIAAHNFEMRRTREYWLGYYLAYYQWEKNISFKAIYDDVAMSDLVLLYNKYHEIEVDHFVMEVDRLRSQREQSMIRRLRIYAGLSQSQLASRTDIPVRTIQQYEQGKKDITKANGTYIINLASALNCEPRDIVDSEKGLTTEI